MPLHVEAGRDDAESAAGGAGRRGLAHQHVARRRDHAAEEARDVIMPMSRTGCGVNMAIRDDDDVGGEAGRGSITVPVGAISKSPAKTPTALAPR